MIKLNNTSQYAIRILAYIADNKEKKLFSAAELSNKLSIPYKFLTKIMTELAKADFIESLRGREGGFKLKKDASKIKVDDILNIFNDSIKDEECILGIGFCNGMCKCSLHDQWMEPKLLMQKMFCESSLQDIAGRGCKI